MMKKIFILLTAAVSLLLFVNPSPVFATLVNNDTDIESEFIKYQENFTGLSGVAPAYNLMDFEWTYEVGQDIHDSNIYVKSPKVLVNTQFIQNIQIPNYVVHLDQNGQYHVQTSAFTNAYLYIFNNESDVYAANQTTLSNYGPGGQSSYRLNNPIAVSGNKWIQIVYTISLYSVPGQQLSNDTHEIIKSYFDATTSGWVVITPNTFHNRMRRYTASVRLSFRHDYINLSQELQARNHYSKVTIREQVEFNPPNPDDPINPGEYNSISDLPATAGSIFTNTSGMGRVYFNVSGYNLITKVEYQSVDYYIPFSMENGTDMSIFNNANKSFYYMYEGERFILINHGNESIFESTNLSAQKWVGYSVWNLNTNELNTFDRLNVYLYSKLEDANNVYGYFYIDDYVVDRLLSVSLSMRYKYNYVIGQSDWKIHNKILEADVYETFDPTSWQLDVLAGTAVATSVLALIPGVQIPALIVGSAIMAGVGSTIQSNPIAFGSINQIEKVQPTGALLNEINTAYAASNPSFKPNTTDMSIYKLYIGQFNDLWSVGIDIDTEYSLYQSQQGINIIQMSFMKDRQLYVLDGENINMNFTPGPGTDGQTPGFSFPNLNLSVIIAAAGGVIIGVMVLIGGIQSGVLFNRRRGFNFSMFLGTLFGALLAGGLIALLLYFGVNYFLTGGG